MSDTSHRTVHVDVDPKVAAAVAAWATQVAARAVWTASGTQRPRWIAMVVALLADLAAQLAQADGQAVGTAGHAGTTPPISGAAAQSAFLWGGLVGGGVTPAPPADLLPAEPGTAGQALDELGTARLAVDAADTLAVAQRVGDAQDVADALAAYEQASLTYHLVAGRRLAGEADGGIGP